MWLAPEDSSTPEYVDSQSSNAGKSRKLELSDDFTVDNIILRQPMVRSKDPIYDPGSRNLAVAPVKRAQWWVSSQGQGRPKSKCRCHSTGGRKFSPGSGFRKRILGADMSLQGPKGTRCWVGSWELGWIDETLSRTLR